MKVKRYQFNTLPFISIVDEYDCPIDPYLSCYLGSVLSAKSPNTRFRYANDLLFALRHFSQKDIDLGARASSGKFISQKEYMQFFDSCFFNSGSGGDSKVINFLDVNNKHLRNIISANHRGMTKVASETIVGRIRQLRNYLVWLYDQFHEVNDVDEVISKSFRKLIAKMKLDQSSLKASSNKVCVSYTDSVIPDEVFVRLLEMILPSSPNNPFKASKVRNYLVVSILIRSGIRRGALAKLKISDFCFYGTYDQISIYRAANDPTDTRTEKPNQKTKAHFATISSALMEQAEFYIDNYRSRYNQAQFHDFFLVSENDSKGTIGQPLSLKSINAIFSKLSSALGFHIHPHILRHKWNELFDECGARLGVDPVILEDVRKYAMGWSPKSVMANTYNEKRIALKARQLSEVYQQEMDKK